jgi:hypothetical protein
MKINYLLFSLILLLATIPACNNNDKELSQIEAWVVKAENKSDQLIDKDWVTMSEVFQKSEENLKDHPNNYSALEVKQFYNLRVRYTNCLKTKEEKAYDERLDEWAKIIEEAGNSPTDSL